MKYKVINKGLRFNKTISASFGKSKIELGSFLANLGCYRLQGFYIQVRNITSKFNEQVLLKTLYFYKLKYNNRIRIGYHVRKKYLSSKV